MRRAAKVDANQAKVVATLRTLGFSVQPLHAVGGGVPDLLVARAGVNHLVEVKDGSLVPSARRLNPIQQEWHAKWRGSVVVINSPDEAVIWACDLAGGSSPSSTCRASEATDIE